jgi:Cu(I)/Ag(I) efflux system membrane protein CusA/SilA
MVGGMVSSTLLTLLVIPAIYSLWKEREARRLAQTMAEPVVVEGWSAASLT